MRLWALRLERPLADVLMERHLITDEDRREIERKIERKISRHGNIRASLAAVAAANAHDLIRSVDHPDIRNSLSSLPPAIGHVLIETLIPPHESRDVAVHTDPDTCRRRFGPGVACPRS